MTEKERLYYLHDKMYVGIARKKDSRINLSRGQNISIFQFFVSLSDEAIKMVFYLLICSNDFIISVQ